MLVKYTARPSLEDRTEEIKLAPGEGGDPRVLVFNGEAVEVTPEEIFSIQANGYGITPVEDAADDVPAAEAPTPEVGNVVQGSPADTAQPYDPTQSPDASHTDTASPGA